MIEKKRTLTAEDGQAGRFARRTRLISLASLVLAAAAALTLGAACSSSANPEQAGHPNDGGPDGTADANGSSSGSSGGRDDGSMTEPDGGTPSDATAGDVRVTPASDGAMDDPTCSPNTVYGAASNVGGVPTFAAQPLVTMTNDELTLAWVVDNGGGHGTVYVTDRASTGAAFAAATQVPSSSTASSYLVDGSTVGDAGDAYFAFDRVALSADGLTLIGVAVGNHAMAQFTRLSRANAFTATPLETPFDTLAQTLMPGEMLGDPVLGANGADLVYSKYGNSPTLSVYESVLSGGQDWPSGAGQNATALAERAGQRKRPTSLTADRRTLFVWDEAGTAYGLLREDTTAQFNFAISFGSRFSIQVNGNCSRIYWIAAASGGYALVQADAM